MDIYFTFDTGSEVSVLTERSSKLLKLQLEKPKKMFGGANSNQLNVLRMCNANVQSTYRSIETLVYTARGSKTNLRPTTDAQAQTCWLLSIFKF